MSESLTRRRVLMGMAAMTVAAVATPTLATSAQAATSASQPLPLVPLRIPKADMGVEQQPDDKVQWLQDAKLGMFIHWGVYSGPEGPGVSSRRTDRPARERGPRRWLTVRGEPSTCACWWSRSRERII